MLGFAAFLVNCCCFMWNNKVLATFFCVSRETLQVLSRGRGCSGYFATIILFFAEVVAYYNCFTWNICCFDDNRRTLAITVGWQRPAPRIFLFSPFFHLPPPFLSVLLSFAYLSTGHFSCCACFLFFHSFSLNICRVSARCAGLGYCFMRNIVFRMFSPKK